jgi:diaminohydroxyphosphoribosylaminopyrimidine deaminase/5-amino-6-(5-phosphoribosylamino)uracil reductase
LRACGVEIVQVARDARGRPDLTALLAELAQRKVTRLLVEGGATVHSAFLDRGLADRLEIFTAPMVLGAAAHGSIGALAASSIAKAARFHRVSQRRLGIDLLESFVAKA